ncbi:MAG: DUF386 domain-containing protein [Lachnospiraceae bacterium]|nr:DUF386 domain-containing protein [Lachnospiraceae bacterium]
MVIDLIRNYQKYAVLHPLLVKGIKFALSLTTASAGRYEQREFYALVQEDGASSLEEGDYETHKKYMDVQIIVKGTEILGWQEVSKLKVKVPYSEEKDICFYEGEGISLKVGEGMFYLLMPQDAHKACMWGKEEAGYKKIVLKIPIEG